MGQFVSCQQTDVGPHVEQQCVFGAQGVEASTGHPEASRTQVVKLSLPSSHCATPGVQAGMQEGPTSITAPPSAPVEPPSGVEVGRPDSVSSKKSLAAGITRSCWSVNPSPRVVQNTTG